MNDQLHAKLQEEGSVYKSSMENLEKQMDLLRREYFFSTALAVKLNLSGSKVEVQNIGIQSLFEKAIREEVPLEQWPKWITSNF